MYQSISVRVLRQAMDWMGIPSPWFRTVETFTFPNGDFSSTVKCMWNASEMLDALEEYGEAIDYGGPGLAPYRTSDFLRHWLEQSFCEDIQVVTCQYLHADRMFVAYLSCKIARQPNQLEELS